ncbi:hypothetical protein WOLCODRAFT_29130 [Wolfiporia cocos MD-104 SS10]|uniref:Uncharacterized protein n=1 Tax=Wolfiporia cocos (strain MD-104) TaxID=742152 RepID=A0A2H3J6C5_WOLCO|nr:hypothetical protein WOLCODRAFT_29130 [Wolfiporia cocos MD-104 SS10]
MPEQYMPPFEKTHPPSYMQRPPEHPRQMAPEYPPPPPQAMPPQAWMHNPSASTWEPYKY